MNHSQFKKAFVLAIICTCLVMFSGCSSKFICTGCGKEQTGKKYESSYTLGNEKIVLCKDCYDDLLGLIGH